MKVNKLLSISALAVLSMGLTVCGPALNANAADDTGGAPKTDNLTPQSSLNTPETPGSLKFDPTTGIFSSNNKGIDLNETNGDNSKDRSANINANGPLTFEDNTGSGQGWKVYLKGSVINNGINKSVDSAYMTMGDTVSKTKDNENDKANITNPNKSSFDTILNDSSNPNPIASAPAGQGEGKQQLTFSHVSINIPTSDKNSDIPNSATNKSYTANLNWTLTQGPKPGNDGNTTRS